MSLEILQNSQENTCARASFLHTLNLYHTLFYHTDHKSQIELLLVGLLTKAYEKYQAKNLFSNLYSTLFKPLRVGNYCLRQGRTGRSYMIHRADLRIFELFQENVRDEKTLIAIKVEHRCRCAPENFGEFLKHFLCSNPVLLLLPSHCLLQRFKMF